MKDGKREVRCLYDGIRLLFTSVAVGLVIACSLFIDGVASMLPSEDGNGPRGHLKSLGEHRPAEGFITTVDGFLDPETFYKNHVLASKPVLFKGAAHDLPAYQRWSDTYLDKKYGGIVIEVEHGKKEDRSGRVSHLTISQFLREYKEKDIYMVQDVVPEMMGDFIVPRPVQCGGFQKVIQTAVLWFSSGGTRSVLHNDDMDNINCILDGHKSLVMIDKKYQSLVEDEHYVFEKSYSRVDVEKVDLHKHPGLADIPWWEAHMEKGDCLYIPVSWYHTVASSDTRNLAANLWLAHIAWFNATDCIGCCSTNPLLGDVHVGQTVEVLRHDVFSAFEGMSSVTLEEAVAMWKDILAPIAVQELFEVMDLDKDLVLSWEEIFKVDIEEMIREFPELVGGVEEEEQTTHDEL